MSTNKEWGCSVSGCTPDDRVCMRMVGLSKGEQPKELVTFVKSPLGTFCTDSVRYLARETERLQVQISIRDGEAALHDKHGNAVTPEAIAAKLEEYVRGQSYGIKRIARSLYYFLLSREIRKSPELLKQFDLQPEQLPKLNMLMPGPSGSGKTYIWEQVQRLFGIPVCITSVTDVTASGFVGASIDDKIGELVSYVADYLSDDGKREVGLEEAINYIETEGAILVLDEIDKKAAPVGGENNSSGRDISGTSVQQELLTVIQGSTVRATIGKNQVAVSTRLVLFAAMGAFSPPESSSQKTLKSIVLNDLKGESNFEGADNSEEAKERKAQIDAAYARHATDAHFRAYGFMPELLGRLMSCYAPLNELSEDDMRFILTEVRGNRVSAYKAFFAKRGLEVCFEDEALTEIARIAKKSNLNARALDNVLSNIFVEVDMLVTRRVAEGYNYLYISKEMVVKNGEIVENGPKATFQKRTSSELLQVESDGVDEDA